MTQEKLLPVRELCLQSEMPRRFPNEAYDACKSTKRFLDFLRNRRQLRNNAQKIGAFLSFQEHRILCVQLDDTRELFVRTVGVITRPTFRVCPYRHERKTLSSL